MSSSHIIGYVDPVVVSAGSHVAVKVSCSRATYTSKVLRLGPGFDHPDAPLVEHQIVKAVPQQNHHGKPQYSRLGSFARINEWNGSSLQAADVFSVKFRCQATLPEGAGHEQFLFSSIDTKASTGFAAFIDETGHLSIRVGGAGGIQETSFDTKLVRHQWYALQIIIDCTTRKIKIEGQAKGRDLGERSVRLDEERQVPEVPKLASEKPLIVASDSSDYQLSSSPIQSGSFNGKIDGFKLETTSNGIDNLLLDLDFSLLIPTDQIQDKSKNQCHGELINAPARAVTGYDWDASYNDWTRAPYGYAAIHFHDDDLDDAAWETDFEVLIPTEMRSGCYGFLVDDGQSSDIIPFFVRPDLNASEVPPVALIIPTFTYIAYANEHMQDESREAHFAAEAVAQDEYFKTLQDRPDLGISLYDSHSDGSGAIFSSFKRPVLNFRSKYSFWAFKGPREFPADLWFVGFLDRELGAEGYDVITDHDISLYGAPLLKKYKVLMSGSHPEYPTYSMLDSYASFLENGGHFMYLGGNGYYWVTSHDTKRPHRIEVRRCDQGCRTFGLPPGNWHLSMTGEQGGLWRPRGRPPQLLFGVGSCALGLSHGAGYGITPEARSDPRLSFLFHGAGLESASVIGDFAISLGAASADEIDRLDYSLGTPQNAVIIATTKLAGGHSEDFLLFNEESMYPMVNTTGPTSDKVRSDLVYFDTLGGGAVVSVGSMNWVNAMAWKGYKNNVAQITANVLHEFIRRGKASTAKGD